MGSGGSLTGAGVVVVGAGLTGLAIADALAKAGVAVTVVDRNDRVGGLARTFGYGGWFFDAGPHRFSSADPEIAAFVRRLLGADAIELARLAAFHLFGKTRSGPPRRPPIGGVPFAAAIRAAVERRRTSPEGSLDAHATSAYGKAYATVLRQYVERLLGVPADAVHQDFAEAAFDAPAGAGADVYPASGIGALADRLAHSVVANGGRVLLGRHVGALEKAGERVTAVDTGQEWIAASAVAWTGPVTDAMRLLGHPAPELRFRSTVLYNVALREPSTLGHPSVTYFDDERFVRVSDPTAFSPAAAPPGKGGLSVECVCREGDGLWRDPARHVPSVLVGLAMRGAISSVRSVENVFTERIANTYPVQTLGYREQLEECTSALSRVSNLVVAGRSGAFRASAMDEALREGFRVARRLEALVGDGAAARDDGGRPCARAAGRQELADRS